MSQRHPLIRSEAGARGLALLSSAPGQELHTNELIRRTKTNPRAMQRALVRLEQAGMLTSRRVGNLRLWRMEQSHPLYASIRDLFARTRGVPARLRQVLEVDRRVQLAFLFGSYVTAQDDPTSDIDLFVLGRPDGAVLGEAIDEAAREVGREIRPVIWSRSDLARPNPGQSSFLENIAESPKIWLVGSEDDFEERRAKVGTNLAASAESPADRPGRGSGARKARLAQRRADAADAGRKRSRRGGDLRGARTDKRR